MFALGMLVVTGCDCGGKSATCTDGVVNRDETDVDCGGAICGACGDGLVCEAGSDCTSGGCDASGSWSVRDIVAYSVLPTDAAFPGTTAVWDTETFGAAFLPDGTLAVSFQNDSTSDLWCATGR